MNPLLMLFAGIAVGAMGVRLAKSSNLPKALQSTALTGGQAVRTGLNQAGSGVRGAAVLGLQTVEKTSAALQRKLNTTPSPSEGNPTAPEETSEGSAREGSTATPEAKDDGVFS